MEIVNSERISKTPENYQIPPKRKKQKETLKSNRKEKLLSHSLQRTANFGCVLHLTVIKEALKSDFGDWCQPDSICYCFGFVCVTLRSWKQLDKFWQCFWVFRGLESWLDMQLLNTKASPQQCWCLNIRKIWCWCFFSGLCFTTWRF